MRPSRLPYILLAAACLLIGGYFALSYAQTMRVPALFRGDLQRTSGTVLSACPHMLEDRGLLTGRQPAEFAELNRRLSERFPVGSNASRIVMELKQMGFERFEPCTSDASIQNSFHRWGNLTGIVTWKADSEGKIVWTRGFVMHEGF